MTKAKRRKSSQGREKSPREQTPLFSTYALFVLSGCLGASFLGLIPLDLDQFVRIATAS
jgi:hypothetical protein